MSALASQRGKLWSFAELMHVFPLDDYAVLFRNLSFAICALEKQTPTDYDSEIQKAFVELAQKTHVFSLAHGLKACANTITATLEHIRDKDALMAVLATEARHVRDALEMAAYLPKFLLVEQRNENYVNNDQLFGAQVHSAFPSARSDIRESGNCLAADCNTAAVFHMMRAVEWGMRSLCAHLGFKQLKTHTRTGKVKYKPVEYSEWEKILEELQDRVDRKLNRMRRGSRKQELQTFYYPALQEIRSIRDAWRNHVMHTRAEYSPEDATAILAHVKRLLQQLATRVSEV